MEIRGDELFPDPFLSGRERSKMDEGKHKAVVDALAELIRSQLASSERDRFASVSRLAVIGQKLLFERAPRPGDADADEDVDMEDDHGIVFPRRRARANLLVAGNDQQQMVREMVAMLAPAMTGLQQQNVARSFEARARELNELFEAKDRLGGSENKPALDKVTKRIDAIIAMMGEEDGAKGDEDGLSMVPAVDVRRHQAGPAFVGVDTGDADGAVADREGGGAGAVRTGDEARAAPRAMGVGG
jgi:hypothetical protein